MKSFVIPVFLSMIVVGCSNGNKHTDIKVKALHAWEKGRAKNCMLLNGNPSVQGGTPQPDPKEMWCTDQRANDPDNMQWEYIRISNVVLDEVSEKEFHDKDRWAVHVVCEEVSKSELKCVSDSLP